MATPPLTRTITAALLAVVAVAGCTPRQLAAFIDWHEQDPAAAEAFANQPHIQADLAGATSSPPAAEVAPAPTIWDNLAWCESGEQWAYNGGSGYDGGLQFLPAVWDAYGGDDFADRAWQASREQQIVVAERILADVGWQAWPACSRRLGLR